MPWAPRLLLRCLASRTLCFLFCFTLARGESNATRVGLDAPDEERPLNPVLTGIFSADSALRGATPRSSRARLRAGLGGANALLQPAAQSPLNAGERTAPFELGSRLRHLRPDEAPHAWP